MRPLEATADFIERRRLRPRSAMAGEPDSHSPMPASRRCMRLLGQATALAHDAAFSFIYPHLVQGWRAAGAAIVPFSLLADKPPSFRLRRSLASGRLSGVACRAVGGGSAIS